MQGHVQAKLLLDDCYQDIDANGDPDLRPHSILGSAVETFDAQVLLDPLEEQFHLPSAPVQGANGQRRQRKLVGQEHQVLRKVAAYTLKNAAFTVRSLCKAVASCLNQISRTECAAYLANSGYGPPKRKPL